MLNYLRIIFSRMIFLIVFLLYNDIVKYFKIKFIVNRFRINKSRQNDQSIIRQVTVKYVLSLMSLCGLCYSVHAWYLLAQSIPFCPISRNCLIVEGMEGSKAFRSMTPWPSACSTPTLTPPSPPLWQNWTSLIAAELAVLLTVPAENTALSLLRLSWEIPRNLIY